MVLDAVSGLLGLDAPPPAVRRATLAVRFGGDAEAWRANLIAAQVLAGLLPSVDEAAVILADTAGAPAPPLGTGGEIRIGYDDSSTETAFTGQIASIGHSIDGRRRFVAVNGGAALAALRLNRSYEARKAGEIVRDLAAAAGVSTGTIENGISLPFLHIDDGRSALQHIAALARRSGCIAYFSPAGKLEFKPFAGGQPAARFEYGRDIMTLSAREAEPPIGEIAVQGEGAAGAQGSDAWSWLIKDPAAVRKTAGAGKPQRSWVDRALRSAEAAGSAAKARAEAAGWQAFTGELRAAGAASAHAGSAVEIASAPVAALNGLCLVRWVRHHYDKVSGFTTTIGFIKVGNAGGSGGLLEALGGLL